MNKTFALPGKFAILETANDAGAIPGDAEVEVRAEAFAANMRKHLLAAGKGD